MTPFDEVNRVTSPYGNRTLNGVPEFHNGQDIVGDKNWNVRSIWDCEKVEVSIGYNGGRGNVVYGYYNSNLRYLAQHLDSIFVKNGQKVKQGDKIGVMGNTGYSFGVHLHIEIQIFDNGWWQPVEPSKYTEVPNKVGTYPGNNNLDGEVDLPVPEPPREQPMYMIITGPMSEGDKNTIEATATKLGLPVEVKKQ